VKIQSRKKKKKQRCSGSVPAKIKGSKRGGSLLGEFRGGDCALHDEEMAQRPYVKRFNSFNARLCLPWYLFL